MARNFIGQVVDSPYVLSAVNPTIGISSIPVTWGILNTGIEDYTYSKQNTLPYVVGTATTHSSGQQVSSLTLTTPVNSTGDLLLAFFGSSTAGKTFSSSGWRVARENSAVDPSLAVLYKTSSGNETSTQTFNITGGDYTGRICY